MLKSKANLLISIRNVTQVNSGKKSPRIVSHTRTDATFRWDLTIELATLNLNSSEPRFVRRIYSTKLDGRRRILGVSTIKDKVIQTIVKNALEPE